ncbi:MAG TPA: alpha-amylase family glycosyl hydrolase [Symbiobacteriaceae bacterium]|nr:alpha-amylase family glycosyl hydrolase [Symbiobacteriaceae bacterium]
MNRVRLAALAVLLLLAGAVPGAAAATPPVASAKERIWPDESIYFIMVDRFHNGDPANDGRVNPADPKAWHGGDLQGVIDKLDYIKQLGFTAIWLTPIVKNDGNDYHGYGAIDFFETDPHFGTVAKAKELVDKAHAKGLKVIWDVVVNHTGPTSPLVREHPDWFHPKARITDWNDSRQIQEGWIYDLPDFDQSKPEVREYILKYSRFWIEQTGADGFRLDTVKHVPPEFFAWYAQELQKIKPGFWLIGESWDQMPERPALYQQQGIAAMIDFPTSETARDVFGKGGSMSNLANATADVGQVMPNPWQMGGFLDNHDMARFVSFAPNDQVRRLKLGLTWLFTQRSIPIMYYGTEIAMAGGNDPDNRHDFPWGKEENPEVGALVRQLNQIRHDHMALRRGTVVELAAKWGYYAFGRAAGDDRVIVVLNNEETGPLSTPIDVTPMALADGTRLTDALSGKEVVVAGGQIQPEVGPRSGAIYVVPGRKVSPAVLWGGLLLAGAGASAAVVLWTRKRRR